MTVVPGTSAWRVFLGQSVVASHVRPSHTAPRSCRHFHTDIYTNNTHLRRFMLRKGGVYIGKYVTLPGCACAIHLRREVICAPPQHYTVLYAGVTTVCYAIYSAQAHVYQIRKWSLKAAAWHRGQGIVCDSRDILK